MVSWWGLKTGMDFWGQVWKRVWEIACFGLKLGLDLEMRAAHLHQKFQRVPPPGFSQSCENMLTYSEIVFNACLGG